MLLLLLLLLLLIIIIISMVAIHLSVAEQSLGNGKAIFTGIARTVEDEIQRSKTVLQMEREVLEGLIIPSIIIDSTGKIHAFNDAASQLLGYSLLQVIGRNVKMLMPPKYAAEHDTYLKNYLTTGKAKLIGKGREVTAKHKNGSLVKIKLSVTEKKDESGHSLFTGILQKV